MKRSGWIFLVLAGCVDSSTESPSCEPVVTVDEAHGDASYQLSMLHDGVSVCARMDATDVAQPHLVVSGPIDNGLAYQLELRDLQDRVIATGTDVTINGIGYREVSWDPAGGTGYDFLLHAKPTDPRTVSATMVVGIQLSSR